MGSVGHFSEVRRIQKQKLLMFIQEHQDMDLEKVLGLFSLNTGMKVATLKTYVEELKLAGVIE